MRGILLLAALTLVQCAPKTGGPIGFAQATLLQHRIGGETRVEIPADGRRWYGDVVVRVTIGPDGLVRDAAVRRDDNYGPEEPTPAFALNAARAMRFRPFTYRGKPVTAIGKVTIRYVARNPGAWHDPDAALPPIDYSSLRITLTRTMCNGACPDYSVTIDGTGTVTFAANEVPDSGTDIAYWPDSMSSGVLVRGTHHATIDRATLDALIAQFRAIHFFGLRKAFSAEATDQSTQIIRFETGGRAWEVTDYVGEEVGMPAAVTALEAAIDTAAGTARWVSGDARTLPGLRAEGLETDGRDARVLALLSSQTSNGRVALDLIAAGMPLDDTLIYRERGLNRRLPLGTALLESAVRHSQPDLFSVLKAKGWLARMPRAALDMLFAESGGGCDHEIARTLVAAGADPNARAGANTLGYGLLAGNETALLTAVSLYQCDRADKPALVRALLALGVDVNALDAEGRSAIFGLEDPEILEVLLEHGARADIRGRDGMSAVFYSATDALALRLLELGADPHGYFDYGNGKRLTLWQATQPGDMPGVRAWLDARGIR